MGALPRSLALLERARPSLATHGHYLRLDAIPLSRLSEQEYAQYLADRAIRLAKGKAAEHSKPTQAVAGEKYTFIVYGKAEPGGSKQAFVPLDKKTKEPFRRKGGGVVVSVVDANPKAGKWKRHIAKVAREEYGGPMFTQAIAVQFIFYRPRPASHYGTTGLNKQGRDNPFPATKPDVLKLARAAEDACTGICWQDDALIVRETIWKEYGEPARVEITIQALNVETGQQPLLTTDPLPAPAPWEVKDTQ